MTNTSATQTLATGFLIAAAAALAACSQTEDPAIAKQKADELNQKISTEFSFRLKLKECIKDAFDKTMPVKSVDTSAYFSISGFAEDDIKQKGKAQIGEYSAYSDGSMPLDLGITAKTYSNQMIKGAHSPAFVVSEVEFTGVTTQKTNYSLPGYTHMSDFKKNEFELSSEVTVTLPRAAFDFSRAGNIFKGETTTHISPTLPKDDADRLVRTTAKIATLTQLCMGKNF